MKNPLEPLARWLRKRSLLLDLAQIDAEEQREKDNLADLERRARDVVSRAWIKRKAIREELDLLDAESERGEWWRCGLFLAAVVPMFAAAVVVTV